MCGGVSSVCVLGVCLVCIGVWDTSAVICMCSVKEVCMGLIHVYGVCVHIGIGYKCTLVYARQDYMGCLKLDAGVCLMCVSDCRM